MISTSLLLSIGGNICLIQKPSGLHRLLGGLAADTALTAEFVGYMRHTAAGIITWYTDHSRMPSTGFHSPAY